MKQPLISVCIVSYNHQTYIADCLASVLAQHGHFRLEIVLGDDASTDNTVGIVQEMIATYRGNAVIRLFAHEKNLGPSQNYQFLIAQAQGDFIAHLDGDDFWLPGKLQAQLDFLLSHPDCPACYTNTLVMRDDKSHWGFFNRTQPERISLETLVKVGNFLNHSSLLYRATTKAILLAFPENFIDYRIHLALAQHGELGFINQVLVAYRFNSKTSVLSSMRDKFMLLYIDALVSMKNSISHTALKHSFENFLKNNLYTLWRHNQKTTINIIINHIYQIYPIKSWYITIVLIPQSFLRGLWTSFYFHTWGHELRFLQRNHRKLT